jgi:hypothetical protein
MIEAKTLDCVINASWFVKISYGMNPDDSLTMPNNWSFLAAIFFAN